MPHELQGTRRKTTHHPPPASRCPACSWYGTQGGGWGCDAGTTVYAADSGCGNGRVTVTAHPADSLPSNPTPPAHAGSSSSSGAGGGWEEWRVLRFNDVTRQTVMRVHVLPPAHAGGSSSSRAGHRVVAQPDCLAQPYLKTVAAAAAALLGLQRLLANSADQHQHHHQHHQHHQAQHQQHHQQHHHQHQQRRLRVLCIGVGGGSLPLFLAHHFPGMGAPPLQGLGCGRHMVSQSSCS